MSDVITQLITTVVVWFYYGLSLRSWRYCKRTRNKNLAAEPTSERRSREENGEWD